MELNKIYITQESIADSISKEEVQKILSNLVTLVENKMIKYFLPEDRDYLFDFEFYRIKALVHFLEDIKLCNGFSDHILEYRNNFDTTFFVSHLATYLKAHNLSIELEPKIQGLKKRPDILATQNNTKVYFECKMPFRKETSDEQEFIFECLKEILSHEYTLAVFYSYLPDEETLHTILSKSRQRLIEIGTLKEDDVIYEDNQLKMKIIVSGVNPCDKNQDIVITGLPVFNHFGFNSATGINRLGKNVIFYKTANVRIVENQLNESLGKVLSGSNYVVAICTDDRRIDTTNIPPLLNALFEDKKYESISGVLVFDTLISEKNEFGLDFRYIANINALSRIDWLGNVLHNRVFRTY